MKKCLKMNMPKYKQGDTAYILLGTDGGGFLVTIDDVYFVNNHWEYEIDCSNYANDMVLENVPEDYLSKSVNPKKYNKAFTHTFFLSLYEEHIKLDNQ